MLKMEKKILDNNLQYFKGTIEKIVEEIDFKGKPHEMLLIGDLYKQTVNCNELLTPYCNELLTPLRVNKNR